MYDSVRAKNIPAGAAIVAGYVDEYSIPKWTPAEWGRFPHAVKVRVAKKASTNDGHVLDVEDRLARPDEAPGWARMRRRSGLLTPTIYCNRSTWPLVRAEFDRQGEPQPLYWIATASGKEEIPAGAIAAQYLLDTKDNTDVSAVADFWPGVDPAPIAPSSPTISSGSISEEDYTMTRVPKGGAAGGIGKAVNFQLAVSMLREHDVIIAPGDMPVVLYASYHWAWTKGTGGNPVTDPAHPVVVPVQGSYSFIVPKGTGKVDLVYWADDDFTVTVAPR